MIHSLPNLPIFPFNFFPTYGIVRMFQASSQEEKEFLLSDCMVEQLTLVEGTGLVV